MTKKPLAIVTTEEVKGTNLETHFRDGAVEHFSKGETIIDGSRAPQGVYLIKEGFVKAFTITKAGQENLLLIHDKDDFIPLIWALDGAHPEGLYYQAMSDVTVLRTSKEKLRSAMDNNIWLNQELLRQSVNIITAYVRRIQTLGLRTARDRLIAELINLTDMFGKTHGNEIVIDAPITHQEIADSISMNRETASRALGMLFDEGLVKQVEHQFSVKQIDKLEDAGG